tara:strand:- start:103 stop:243 length:141 start_codon:yes stop_codon:yes gene_type:complete
MKKSMKKENESMMVCKMVLLRGLYKPFTSGFFAGDREEMSGILRSE